MPNDLDQKIDNWFSNYPPFGDQFQRYEKIRDIAGKRLARAILLDEDDLEEAMHMMEQTIYECCPNSHERKYALLNLEVIDRLANEEECINLLRFAVVMPAIAAISCNENS